MGKDDLHHKRRNRSARDFERRRAQRQQRSRILIVCEGSNTEPHYFDGLLKANSPSTTSVKVCGEECGSSPKSVVEFAIQVFETDTEYDEVFCVFDRDNHGSSYREAIRLIEDQKQQGRPFQAIPSIPCFEYWILLHFEYTRQPFHGAGKRSICDNLIRELRRHIEDYDKGRKDIYTLVANDTEKAIEHAKQAEADAADTGSDNPSTQMHMLVRRLLTLDTGK